MKFLRYIFPFLLLGLGLTGCKTSNLFVEKKTDNTVAALDSVFFSNEEYEYRVRKDDKISISVWGNDDLSIGSSYGIYNSNEVYGKWLMVDAKGNIEAPKIGTLQVLDKTIIELKDTIRTILMEWVKKPIVDVKVLNREITVLGEVRNPQILPIDKDKNSILEMIARCGGFEFYANVKYVKILRQVGPDVYVANIDFSKAGDYAKKNVNVLPGDIIIIPSKKYKEFDKRVSTIIPFTTTVSAAALIFGFFK